VTCKRLLHFVNRIVDGNIRLTRTIVVVVVVVVVPSDGSVVTSVAEFDELGTGDVERAQVNVSSPV